MTPSTVVLRPARSHEFESALTMVLSEHYSAADVRSQVDDLTGTAGGDPGVFDYLLIAERNDRMVGATWGATAPGRTAGVWPPVLIHAEREATSGLLMSTLEERLSEAGMRLMQAMLPTDGGHASRRLISAGFNHGAHVIFLIREIQWSGMPESRSELDFVPIADEDSADLAEVIEATYEDSRDFSILNGRRELADIMQGYRSAAADTVHLWYVAEHLGEPVGCLLLFDYPGEGQVELAYMGLIASARGRGWGRQLVSRAEQVTARLGRERLVVAVDSENRPALSIYESMEFTRCGACHAYIKVLDAD